MSRAQTDRLRAAARHPGAARDRRALHFDANLWGRSIECGVSRIRGRNRPRTVYLLTRAPAEAPDLPAYVEIEFERGVPVGDQRRRDVARRAHPSPRNDCRRARRRPARYGREPAVDGTVARSSYEAPAAVPLQLAHAELQRFVTAARSRRGRWPSCGATYADLIDQRRLVLAGARRPRRARRERAGARHRRRPPEVSSRATAASSAASRRVSPPSAAGRPAGPRLGAPSRRSSPDGDLWSGRFDARARSPKSSSTASRSPSTGGCSTTTSPAARRGPRRSAVPACSRPRRHGDRRRTRSDPARRAMPIPR